MAVVPPLPSSIRVLFSTVNLSFGDALLSTHIAAAAAVAFNWLLEIFRLTFAPEFAAMHPPSQNSKKFPSMLTLVVP